MSFGEIGMFDFFVTFMGVFYAGQATAQLFMFSTSMTKGKNAANYIFWLRELQPTVAETSENADKGPKSGGPIKLDSIRFSYPLRPDAQVLRGIDLEVKLPHISVPSSPFNGWWLTSCVFRSRKASSLRLWVPLDAANLP